MLLLAIVLITGCASSDESHMESKEFTSEAVVDSGLANDSSEYGGLQTNRKNHSKRLCSHGDTQL